MKRISTYCLVVTVLLSMIAVPVSAEELQYDYLLEGKKIGSIKTEIDYPEDENADLTRISILTKISLKMLFVTVFSLDSEERFIFKENQLKEYESSASIDNDKIYVNGEANDTSIVFDVDINGEKGQIVFNNNDFVTISTLEDNLQISKIGNTDTHRILDIDNLMVINRGYKWIKDEILKINRDEINCRVIEIIDTFSSGKSRRWIAKDSLNTLIKEEGRDDSGSPYKVILTEYPFTAD